MQTVLAKDLVHKQLTDYMWYSRIAQIQEERRKKRPRTQIQKGGCVYRRHQPGNFYRTRTYCEMGGWSFNGPEGILISFAEYGTATTPTSDEGPNGVGRSHCD